MVQTKNDASLSVEIKLEIETMQKAMIWIKSW